MATVVVLSVLVTVLAIVAAGRPQPPPPADLRRAGAPQDQYDTRDAINHNAWMLGGGGGAC